MRNTSNKLTALILDYLLRSSSCFAWRQNIVPVGGRFATKRGVSDIVGVYRGRFFGIEIKTGTDRLRPEQVSFIASVDSAGGFVLVVGSFDEFVELWKQKTGSL